MQLSVTISAHNPDRERLARTLAGLAAQTLPAKDWETVLVDNASQPALTPATWADGAPPNLRIIPEPRLGLTFARRRGMAAAGGQICVLVDDDNVLAPDYLEQVVRLLAAHPRVGALGGRSQPDFAAAPPPWAHEFFPLLALRDLGAAPLISQGLRPAGAARNEYPLYAPIGAGMALRRTAVERWLAAGADSPLPDRRGGELSSGGDNDIVLAIMEAGWEVAYFPELRLTHLIPASRLTPGYLARLNRAIQKSWMQVLSRHQANPWPPLTPAGAALRRGRAWFVHRPWRSPAARIRWQGACGHFDGRVD